MKTNSVQDMVLLMLCGYVGTNVKLLSITQDKALCK